MKYVDDKKHGIKKVFHENEVLKSKVRFVNDKKNGINYSRVPNNHYATTFRTVINWTQ